MANNYIDLPVGNGVSSLNGLTGALTLVAGTGITITPGVNTITIAANAASIGITSINADLTTAQTLTTGTTGTDFAIVDNGTGDHKFNLPTASAVNRGALSPTDWSTFNSKQAAGNYITALTGDVTATGPGSVAATIANLAVTNAKIANATIDLTTKVTGILPIANGGTASSATPTNGQLLIGNGTNFTLSTLTAGSGITLTNGAGLITVATSGQTAFTTKSANYTILSTDRIIYVNTSGGAFNLTLPDPTTVSTSTTTQTFTIIDIGGTLNTNNVTLVRFGSEKIEGLTASKLLQTNWGAYRITTNNVDWFIS